MGLKFDGSAYIGGHPDCNQGATLLVERRRGRYLPLLPNDEKTKRLFAEILATLGAISTMTTDAGAVASLLPYRVQARSRVIRSSPSAAWCASWRWSLPAAFLFRFSTLSPTAARKRSISVRTTSWMRAGSQRRRMIL